MEADTRAACSRGFGRISPFMSVPIQPPTKPGSRLCSTLRLLLLGRSAPRCVAMRAGIAGCRQDGRRTEANQLWNWLPPNEKAPCVWHCGSRNRGRQISFAKAPESLPFARPKGRCRAGRRVSPAAGPYASSPPRPGCLRVRLGCLRDSRPSIAGQPTPRRSGELSSHHRSASTAPTRQKSTQTPGWPSGRRQSRQLPPKSYAASTSNSPPHPPLPKSLQKPIHRRERPAQRAPLAIVPAQRRSG